MASSGNDRSFHLQSKREHLKVHEVAPYLLTNITDGSKETFCKGSKTEDMLQKFPTKESKCMAKSIKPAGSEQARPSPVSGVLVKYPFKQMAPPQARVYKMPKKKTETRNEADLPVPNFVKRKTMPFGSLLQGRLKPLYPVVLDNPTVAQCRGIIAGVKNCQLDTCKRLDERAQMKDFHLPLLTPKDTLKPSHLQTDVASANDDGSQPQKPENLTYRESLQPSAVRASPKVPLGIMLTSTSSSRRDESPCNLLATLKNSDMTWEGGTF